MLYLCFVKNKTKQTLIFENDVSLHYKQALAIVYIAKGKDRKGGNMKGREAKEKQGRGRVGKRREGKARKEDPNIVVTEFALSLGTGVTERKAGWQWLMFYFQQFNRSWCPVICAPQLPILRLTLQDVLLIVTLPTEVNGGVMNYVTKAQETWHFTWSQPCCTLKSLIRCLRCLVSLSPFVPQKQGAPPVRAAEACRPQAEQA